MPSPSPQRQRLRRQLHNGRGGGAKTMRILLGLLLLTAAGLKGYEHFTHFTPSGQRIWEARWFQLFLVELEACLGLWLLTGFRWRVARYLAIIAFTMFAGVNVWQISQGEQSCGCFGIIRVDPHVVLVFDFFCVGALAISKPRATFAPADTARRKVPWARRFEVMVVSCGSIMLAGGLAAHALYSPPADLFHLVSVEPPFKNFGPVRQNESLAYDFAVRNNWTHPIEIVKVLSSCSCTLADGFAGTVIAPGQGAPLRVTLKTGQYEGPRSGMITLFFRGPNSTVLAWKSLVVQADVGTDYRVSPTLVDFGAVNSDERFSRRIRLRPNLQKVVQVTGLETDDPIIQIQQVRAPPGDSDLYFDIEPQFQSVRHSGPLSTLVHIRTDSIRSPVTDIRVRAIFAAAVEVVPECIVVGSESAGSVRRDVMLLTRSPARITAVRATGFACQYDNRTANIHKIVVVVPVDAASRSLRADIDFELIPETGVRETRTVTIPVHRLPMPKG
jgi:Protein of unknown function (DUF1573)